MDQYDGAASPLRIAIVGTGFSGRLIHAALIDATPGVEVAVFVAHSDDGRARVAERWPAVPVVASIEEIPAGVDAVVIAGPDATHGALARRSLCAGYPTVVDKPFATTTDEARSLLELAASNRLLLTGFHNRRWDNDYLTLRAVLDTQVIGIPFRFESVIWRWAPTVGAGWRSEPVPGGIDGLLSGVGTHLVDQAIHLFGPVESVTGEVDIRRVGGLTNDDVSVSLRHRNGVRSTLVATSLGATPRPRFRLHGTAGGYLNIGADPQQDALAQGVRPGSPGWGQATADTVSDLIVDGITSSYPTIPGDWREFYVRLRTALSGSGPLPVDSASVVHGLEILEAAQLSSNTGTTVRLRDTRIT